MKTGKSVSDGPSTSAGSSACTREPRWLGRQEFEIRLFERIQTRYGIELDPPWLHDLIKDKLVPGATRYSNDGLRPRYGYGWRTYRRALQIARLRRGGFIERDAIRIQLFVKGYGEHAVNRALWNQYSKVGKSVVAQVRSGYLDNWKDIPAGHKSRLSEQMAPLDPELDAAGFKLDVDTIIYLIRSAKQTDMVDITKPNLSLRNMHDMLTGTGGIDFSCIAHQLGEILFGTLMFTPLAERIEDAPDPIEEAIMGSTVTQFEEARNIFNLFTSAAGVRFLGGFRAGLERERLHAAFEAVRQSARSNPGWAAGLLVNCLVLARRFGGQLNFENMLATIHQIENKNITPHALLLSRRDKNGDN